MVVVMKALMMMTKWSSTRSTVLCYDLVVNGGGDMNRLTNKAVSIE